MRMELSSMLGTLWIFNLGEFLELIRGCLIAWKLAEIKALKIHVSGTAHENWFNVINQAHRLVGVRRINGNVQGGFKINNK